jgi:hypothetical protein
MAVTPGPWDRNCWKEILALNWARAWPLVAAMKNTPTVSHRTSLAPCFSCAIMDMPLLKRFLKPDGLATNRNDVRLSQELVPTTQAGGSNGHGSGLCGPVSETTWVDWVRPSFRSANPSADFSVPMSDADCGEDHWQA